MSFMTFYSSKARAAYVYFSIVALDSVSFCLIAPILAPLLAKHSLFFSQATNANYRYGILIALFPLAYMLTSPILGYLSDRFGRKPLLLSCMLCMLAAFICYIVAFQQINLMWLMAGRVLAGVAAGSQILAQAAMVDVSAATHKARAIGWIAVAMTLGLVLGPLVAGLWTASANSYIFIAVIGFTLINIILLSASRVDIATLPQPQVTSSTKPPLAIRRVVTLLAIFLLFELGWSLYYQALPVMLSFQWHYDNTAIGWVCAYVGAALSIALWYASRVGLHYLKARSLMQLAWFIGIGAFVLNACAPGSIWVWLLAALPIVLAVALLYPLLIVALSDTAPAHQGLMIGLSGTVLAAAFTITGFAAVELATIHSTVVFVAAALCWSLGWLWYAQLTQHTTL